MTSVQYFVDYYTIAMLIKIIFYYKTLFSFSPYHNQINKLFTTKKNVLLEIASCSVCLSRDFCLCVGNSYKTMAFLIITSPYCLLINGPIPRRDNEHRIRYSVGTTTTDTITVKKRMRFRQDTYTNDFLLLLDSDTFLFVHVGQHQ